MNEGERNMKKSLIALLLLPLFLVACGGSNDNDPSNESAAQTESIPVETQSESVNEESTVLYTPKELEERPAMKKMFYSNLVEDFTQGMFLETATQSGIPAEQTQVFLKNVKAYNEVVGESLLPGKTFHRIYQYLPNYKVKRLKTAWNDSTTPYQDLTPRIVAFLLDFDRLQSTASTTVTATSLDMDMENIKNNTNISLTDDQLNLFTRLFSDVVSETRAGTPLEKATTVKDAWNMRGIHFATDKNRSLITVVMPSADGMTLKLQHAGVLLDTKDGLVFIEKVNQLLPYQVTIFEERLHLNDYLMLRFDNLPEQDGQVPVILENDALLNGYRKHPEKDQLLMEESIAREKDALESLE